MAIETSPSPGYRGDRATPPGALSGSRSLGGTSGPCPHTPIGCGAPAGQKLDCSSVTRRGHAASSWVRAGGAVPDSQVGSQEAGPAPRPLPPRDNPAEPELATGDLGGEVTWGLGSDGGGGAGGRGSPRESKFPPGRHEWVVRMANFGTQESGPPGPFLSDPGVEPPVPSSLRPQVWPHSHPQTQDPKPLSPPAWDLELPNPLGRSPHPDIGSQQLSEPS